MDKSEFPSLTEATEVSQDKSTLESSWAEVAAQPSPEEEEQKTDASLDHAPNVWEANKENASYADVAVHEKRLNEEFPTPQETIGGDSTNTSKVQNDPTPPNPDRSFADVTSNKDYPSPEKDTNVIDTSLSDLPDVKDMLNQPSVRVPPPPADQSFAKIAAKEIPPEKRPLSERAENLVKQQESRQEEPLSLNDDNFPTLGQSNLMAQENASSSEKSMYSEISRFNQLDDDEQQQQQQQQKKKADQKSFADIASSNLDQAPPSAQSHVDQLPVYDEETVYAENAKREVRKNLNVEHGNNRQLKEEEELKEVQPTKEQRDQEKVNEKIYNTSREIASDKKDKSRDSWLDVFDKNNTGRITIFQTMLALYRLGYSWLSIIPGALFMHLRLSPMTSPYGFPFIYRSPFDLILLPIYTNNLYYALSYQTPMLHQNKEQVDTMVKKYGHQQGLGFWDGIRVLRHMEKDTLRWYQLGLWAIHRIQWTLTYTMLHDPKTNVVTVPTLVSLGSGN